MFETNLLLTVKAQGNQPITEKQLGIIAKALNGWFQDAEFKLTLNDNSFRLQDGQLKCNSETVLLNGWETEFMAQLLSSRSPVKLPSKDGDRVRIHRLKKKLPTGVTVQNKRNGNYMVVNV